MPGPDIMPFFGVCRFCPPGVLREDPGGSTPVMGPGPKISNRFLARGKLGGAGPHNGRRKALNASGETISLWPDNWSGAAGVYFGGGPGPGAVPFTNCPRRRERGRDDRGKFTVASSEATGKSAGYLSRRAFPPRRIILCRCCNQDRLFKKELTKSPHPWHNGRG